MGLLVAWFESHDRCGPLRCAESASVSYYILETRPLRQLSPPLKLAEAFGCVKLILILENAVVAPCGSIASKAPCNLMLFKVRACFINCYRRIDSLLWLKAFHLIFMVTWFAGLFYLPRLFVYHAMSEDTESIERFKVMERNLYYGIMTPGMLLTLASGIGMLIFYAWSVYGTSGWLHVKLGLILVLVAYHIFCGKWLSDFKHDRNFHNHTFYRWINEIPVVFLVLIIVLAVIKPF